MHFCTDLRYIIYISKETINPIVRGALPWKGKGNASESYTEFSSVKVEFKSLFIFSSSSSCDRIGTDERFRYRLGTVRGISVIKSFYTLSAKMHKML